MKLGIVSDVHCNAAQLAAALERLRDCDEVICAGDLMYQYRWNPRVMALVREREMLAIVGNHDLSLLQSAKSGYIQRPEGIEDLAALPRSFQVERAGLRIAVFHGSPWDRPDDGLVRYLFPSDRAGLERAAAMVDVDLLVLGHTHVAMAEWFGSTLVVNPGSCGEVGRRERVFTCASVDLASREVEFHELPPVANQSAGLSESASVP